MATIYQQLLASATTPPHAPQTRTIDPQTVRLPKCFLSSFSPVDSISVAKLVSQAKASTCSLDPMAKHWWSLPCLPYAPSWWTLSTHPLNLALYRPPSASVIAILKKVGLDPDDLHNYRPISNLSFLSKILERAVAAQLQQHMSNHELYEPLQSGFRARHSTETALIKITNDLLIAADSGHISILILLDLSAAFDTISHTILLTRLSDYLGLTGTALSWFQSYLTNRKQFVTIGDSSSTPAPVNQGVPQGSVLGPLLFTIYMLPLGQIIRKHGLNFHSYADDTQLYLCTKLSTQLPPQSLVNYLHDLKLWMTSNLLKLNNSKTGLMVMASKVLLQKVGDLLLDVDGCTISPSTEVRNLGVILDSTLSFQSHIKSIIKSALYHLKNISSLRPSLSEPVAEPLIHAFTTFHLDYCNGILFGLPSKTLDRLQYVQNSALKLCHVSITKFSPWTISLSIPSPPNICLTWPSHINERFYFFILLLVFFFLFIHLFFVLFVPLC